MLQKRRVTEQLFGANRLTSRSFTGALPAAGADGLLLPHVAARSSAVAPEPAADPLSPDEQVSGACLCFSASICSFALCANFNEQVCAGQL